MSWQFGLVVVIALPLAVFVAAVCWPHRVPKDKTVDAIRERIDRE
ncbi:hypothetical protein [Nocardia veterana]|nr:hypothetical protein [Nocardia veterana]